ncbi:MAG: diadenylate cyclase CdaA [Breznakia sp.]
MILNYITLHNFFSLLKLILDIGLVSIVIFYCLKIVKNNSRTTQIVKGIIFIFLIHWIAQQLNLRTIEFITTQFLNWGFLVIFIIFQPELRSMLEKLGRTTVMSDISSLDAKQKEVLINELVKTSSSLSTNRTGALISLEQLNSLADYIRTGTPMNSDVSSELLLSIFVPGTPLHDGAVIIQGNKIACASAYYPPTVKDFPSSYGARHRAAVGISEVSDCITIVVSEETGNISIAQEGHLQVVTATQLQDFLSKILFGKEHVENQAMKKQPISINSGVSHEVLQAKKIVYKKTKKPSQKVKGGNKHG